MSTVLQLCATTVAVVTTLLLLVTTIVIDGQDDSGYGYSDPNPPAVLGANGQSGGNGQHNSGYGYSDPNPPAVVGGNDQHDNGYGYSDQNPPAAVGGNGQYGAGNYQFRAGNSKIRGQNSQNRNKAQFASRRGQGVRQMLRSCDQTNPSTTTDQLIKAGMLNPIEDYFSRQTLSLADIARTMNSSGCVPQISAGGDCSRELCYHLAYRSIDGVCNNLKRTVLGAAFRPYMRHLAPEYADGLMEPAGLTRKSTAREASSHLLANATAITHDQINSLFMQWGQFIAQDMSKTSRLPPDACTTCAPVANKCVPVPISDQDTNAKFRQKGCLTVPRSSAICGTGVHGTPREQLNENTAFVDGSPIYGSNYRDLLKLRDGRSGLLKMSRFNNMMLLPFDSSRCGTTIDTCTVKSFVSGDSRSNTFIGLSSFYILFVREHNRIARVLQKLNPAWSGDRLFQESRKIVGAEIQAVLYNEFMPLMLGPSAERLLGPYNGYEPNVNPSVSNEFTTAAFRFGHGMIVEQYSRLSDNWRPIPSGPYQFNNGTFKLQKLLFEGGIDPVLRGLWSTPIKQPQGMTPAVTEHLFSNADLGTLNIMRGKDHGMPSYNKMRQFCGLRMAYSFDELAEHITDPTIRRALSSIYASPDDIDLYVGGMVEDALMGALVGPTFACIIGNQFRRSRAGDRFYFENPSIFSPAQLTEFKKTSLSRLLCDNGDRITKVPSTAFLLPFAGGGVSACAELPQLDLNKWQE
uniref:peroxidase n=1 Tax=Globodera rostochiensis TaxID=31243 RepID=A0A914H5Y6_GLORO